MNPAPPKITTERKSRSLPLPFDFFALDCEEACSLVNFSCGIVEEKLPWYLRLLRLEQQTPERVVVIPRQFVTSQQKSANAILARVFLRAIHSFIRSRQPPQSLL